MVLCTLVVQSRLGDKKIHLQEKLYLENSPLDKKNCTWDNSFFLPLQEGNFFALPLFLANIRKRRPGVYMSKASGA